MWGVDGGREVFTPGDLVSIQGWRHSSLGGGTDNGRGAGRSLWSKRLCAIIIGTASNVGFVSRRHVMNPLGPALDAPFVCLRVKSVGRCMCVGEEGAGAM